MEYLDQNIENIRKVTASFTLTNTDNGSVIIYKGSGPATISIPTGLIDNFRVVLINATDYDVDFDSNKLSGAPTLFNHSVGEIRAIGDNSLIFSVGYQTPAVDPIIVTPAVVVATDTAAPQVIYTVPAGKKFVPISWTWRDPTGASLAGLGAPWTLTANGVLFANPSAAACRLGAGAYWNNGVMVTPASTVIATAGQTIDFVMGLDTTIVATVTVELVGYLLNP